MFILSQCAWLDGSNICSLSDTEDLSTMHEAEGELFFLVPNQMYPPSSIKVLLPER